MLRKSLTVIMLMGATAGLAELGGSYLLPLDHEAILYSKRPADDAVARLAQRVASGEEKLEFEQYGHGYLRSVLARLGIAADSQVLVFSRTSFQAPRIAPRTPRALYFNDTVSVGIVRGGDVLEIAALDPRQGVIFYTLDQEKRDRPSFDRRDTACLQCHQSGGTLGVPGLMVRSVYPESSGMPAFHAGTFLSDHRSPLSQRWGGWYVSGTHGAERHMGNALIRDRNRPDRLEEENTQNRTDLRDKFDIGAYLTPHSDIVALMTLEHQTHMTNLITRVGWETRMALHYQEGVNQAFGQAGGTVGESTRRRIDSAVEEMLAYMLFVDEAKLGAPLRGVSGFAARFARQGPRDAKGRSLRDFDLERRLFRYPLSFLVYSEAFDAMPEAARERLYRRLWEVLTGRDRSAKFAALGEADRRAIREILIGTNASLPGYWRE